MKRSFFIKKDKKSGHKRSLNKQTKINQNEDEVLSSDESDNPISNNFPSDDENETAQEKKLRLAKIYLEEIEKEESNKLENDEEDCVNGIVSKRLKEDYLKHIGKLKLAVADKYYGADISNVKILKCKIHNRSITCVCLSHDNNFIYSGSKDGSIVKWSLSEEKKISHIPCLKKNISSDSTKVLGHGKPITSIAITSDDKFLAVSDEDKDIQIWNPINLNHLQTLKGHRNTVTGLAFRNNSHTLYSSSKDRCVKVWSLNEMSYVETVYGHQDSVTSIDALSKERAITSGGRDCTIRIWKFGEDSQLVYNGHSGNIDIVRFVNEENFVTGGDDGQLCVWSVMKKKPLCSVKEAHGHDSKNLQPYWIISIAPLLNTDIIATGSCNGLVKFWKLEDNFRKITTVFNVPLIGFINDLAFSGNGKQIIAAVGTEHKNGRWDVIRTAKNYIVIIPLIKLS